MVNDSQRKNPTKETWVLLIDELLRPTVASAVLFCTPDASFLSTHPRALPGLWESALKYIYPTARDHTPPAHTVSYDNQKGLTVSSWHHGKDYRIVISGRPESVALYADLTDNEREIHMIECRKQNASGNEILCVATTILHSPVLSLKDLPIRQSFTITGYIAVKRAVNAPTLQHVRQAQQEGVHVIILSNEHASFIKSFCQHHGLTTRSGIFVDADDLPEDVIQQPNMITSISGIGHAGSVPLKREIVGALTYVSDSALNLLY